MISQAISAAAVGGIAMVWAYFTLKIFKTCKQIVLQKFAQKDVNIAVNFFLTTKEHLKYVMTIIFMHANVVHK